MSAFDPIIRFTGLATLVVGAALALVAAWVMFTGRRPIWFRRRHTLTDEYLRWWARAAGLVGLAGVAIGGPYALSYPVGGVGQLVQAMGFVLMAGGIGCWIYILSRHGYGAQ